MTNKKFKIEKCDLSDYDVSELRMIGLFAHQYTEAIATDGWSGLDAIEDVENAIWKEIRAIDIVLSRIGKLVAIELEKRGYGMTAAPEKECS
jgi:hypothetical protein